MISPCSFIDASIRLALSYLAIFRNTLERPILVVIRQRNVKNSVIHPTLIVPKTLQKSDKSTTYIDLRTLAGNYPILEGRRDFSRL